MAVNDLDAATRAYESVGLRAGRKLQAPRLAAKIREVVAAQGVILLLQAKNTKGSLASYVAQHGEAIIGVSIEVRDLQVARSMLTATIKQELNPYNGPYGKCILVAPEFTHGVWIELFQKPGV
jgi:hypothetical protein